MSFITNAKSARTLSARLKMLIQGSKEFKFLVGFFYFSGYQILYEELRKAFEADANLKFKILVGLEADRTLGRLVEAGRSFAKDSAKEAWDKLLGTFGPALSDPSLDVPDFPAQARFFLKLLRTGQLEIKKTREPVHAKLYLFKAKPGQAFAREGGAFITGSSNLTHAGLAGQRELNVEIGDYGVEEAESFFDELWKRALPLPKIEFEKIKWIVERGSLAAEPTPFEVYALLLRRYLDALGETEDRPGPYELLKRARLEPYTYQIDAVRSLLRIVEEHGGAILADVVGLGKTVIASMVARESGKRGIVIAPPHLLGEIGSHGWNDYLERFGLYDWRAFSTGNLDEALSFANEKAKGVEFVIIDEAHRFRNPDTQDHALLSAITAGRKTLLLTATPINNRPMDAYALLRLFIPPRASSISPTSDLEGYFKKLNQRFVDVAYALRYLNSPNLKRRKKAEKICEEQFGECPPDPRRALQEALGQVARDTKLILLPVTVRRNRKDLEEDPRYRKEVPNFPNIHDPQPLYYKLTEKQNHFYDYVLKSLGPEGDFRGAAYQPDLYRLCSSGTNDIYFRDIDLDQLREDERFAVESQQNLAEFIRRLLVRRFESSFGAFSLTLEQLVHFHRDLLILAREHGYYLLSRPALEEAEDIADGGTTRRKKGTEYDSLDDFFKDKLDEEKREITSGKRKRRRYFSKEDFRECWNTFLKAIEEDLEVLQKIQAKAKNLKICDFSNDPKAQELVRFLTESLSKEPYRKIIVFSEFTDTVEHLKKALANTGIHFFAVGAKPSKKSIQKVISNFDASLDTSKQKNDFDVLITSDRLSEGISLHRAGTVINYDIPWNPTRLIQRLGRVNRVGARPFDDVYLYHFFPTVAGEKVINIREVAERKLELIHKTLGEDVKILSPDEEPTPSGIFDKLLRLPDEEQEVSFDTWTHKEWDRVVAADPGIEERIRDLPNRVKVAMPGSVNEDEVIVVLRKKLTFFAKTRIGKKEETLFLPEVFSRFQGISPSTPRLSLSSSFFEIYREIEASLKETPHSVISSNSLEMRAINNVTTALENYQNEFTEEEKKLLMRIQQDLKHNRFLPRYIARRLQAFDLGKASNLEGFRNILKEIQKKYIHLLVRPRIVHTDLVVGIERRAKSEQRE